MGDGEFELVAGAVELAAGGAVAHLGVLQWLERAGNVSVGKMEQDGGRWRMMKVRCALWAGARPSWVSAGACVSDRFPVHPGDSDMPNAPVEQELPEGEPSGPASHDFALLMSARMTWYHAC